MRSAVALLGLMLACAQAFYVPVRTHNSAVNVKPSFLGQGVASRQVAASRPNQLRASLEDIEKRLLELVCLFMMWVAVFLDVLNGRIRHAQIEHQRFCG